MRLKGPELKAALEGRRIHVVEVYQGDGDGDQMILTTSDGNRVSIDLGPAHNTYDNPTTKED